MESVYRNILIRLLKKKPFYAHLALICKRLEVSSEYAAGITIKNGYPEISYSSELLSGYPSLEQEALIEHLIKHLLHLHITRRKDRDADEWNLATDLAINLSIENLPESSPLPEKLKLADGLSAEEYYEMLERIPDSGGMDGKGDGDSKLEGDRSDAGVSDKFKFHDNHEIWNASESTPAALAQEMLRSQIQDALRLSDWNVPSDIKELVNAILKPSAISWQSILREFLASAGRIGRKNSWMREHRRFAHETPGTRKKRRLRLLVAVDVSESTDTEEIREKFAAELVRISKSRDCDITVLYANSIIAKIEHFSSINAKSKIYRGGGFTDLRPVFEYAKEMKAPPCAIIYLTDGMGEAPKSMDMPTLWVLYGDAPQPASWGRVLRINE